MNWIKSIIVAFVSVMASILFAEIVLSYAKPVNIRNNPKWVADGYTRGHYKPNQEIIGSVGHNSLNPYPRTEAARYSVNKFGYRGKDWNKNHDANIAFFGGSSTFSFHDNDKKAWPFVASECINETSGTKYQNLNFSHPGYSSFDAPHLLLQKGAHFTINWVVTYHLWNDIKFIKPLAVSPDFLFNTQPATPKITVKSILLDMGLFPNLLGNLHIVFNRYVRSAQESYFIGDNGGEIGVRDIKLTLEKIKLNYLALIKLSPKTRSFLFIKQGLLLDEGNNLYDSEISWRLIGLNKQQFLHVQKEYYLMLEEIALKHENVHILDADKLIGKNLKMYEDHVHLSPAAQSILGRAVCRYVTSEG